MTGVHLVYACVYNGYTCVDMHTYVQHRHMHACRTQKITLDKHGNLQSMSESVNLKHQ